MFEHAIMILRGSSIIIDNHLCLFQIFVGASKVQWLYIITALLQYRTIHQQTVYVSLPPLGIRLCGQHVRLTDDHYVGIDPDKVARADRDQLLLPTIPKDGQ